MNSAVIENLIIGAGPGGIQLAYFLSRRNADYLILEKSQQAGHFFARLPRQRKLISINKVYTGFEDREINLRWDWNSLITDNEDEPLLFKAYSKDYFPSADALVDYLNDFVQKYQININFGQEVISVSKQEHNIFEVRTQQKTYYARRVICGVGFNQSHMPPFKGVEHAELYEDYDKTPEKYTNKRVMVIGKGNSGLETADSLIEHTAAIHLLSPNPIKLAWRTHYVGHVRAINNNFLDTYQLKSQNTILDATVDEIELLPNGMKRVHFTYTHAEGQQISLDVHHVILCTGFKFDPRFFDTDTCPIQLTDCRKFPMQTSEWESTTVKNLFFVGVLTHMRDYQKSFSGFIHGFRYNAKVLSKILQLRSGNDEVNLTLTSFEADTELLLQHIIRRVNQDSAMFQQPGFFGDFYLMKENKFVLYNSLPTDFFSEKIGAQQTYIQVTMEYGKLDDVADPFNIYRYPEDGSSSKFIHPVVRLYFGDDLKDIYHLPEDLENNWDNDFYIKPFRRFLQRTVSPAMALQKLI